MLSWIVIFWSIIVMVKIADLEGKSAVLWGLLAVLSCMISSVLIPFPVINIAMGLLGAYVVMFAIRILRTGWRC